MLIDFNALEEAKVPHMNGGEGSVYAKMAVNQCVRAVLCRIPAGASIGLHPQETNDDINFVISGRGKAVCGGEEELLRPGTCHICPKGSTHTILNTGGEDLVLFTVVPQR